MLVSNWTTLYLALNRMASYVVPRTLDVTESLRSDDVNTHFGLRSMLRLAEELLFFALRDDHGWTVVRIGSQSSLRTGGLRADGSGAGRPHRLGSRTSRRGSMRHPVGDDLLDPSLALIAAERGTRDAGYWVERLAAPEIARGVSEGVIDRLIERGVSGAGRWRPAVP